jgi:hypothetical protein
MGAVGEDKRRSGSHRHFDEAKAGSAGAVVAVHIKLLGIREKIAPEALVA